MIKDKWSTIGDKKYAFDSDGKMRTGWYFDNDDIYYLGEKGYAKTGWLCLGYDEDNKWLEYCIYSDRKTQTLKSFSTILFFQWLLSLPCSSPQFNSRINECI